MVKGLRTLVLLFLVGISASAQYKGLMGNARNAPAERSLYGITYHSNKFNRPPKVKPNGKTTIDKTAGWLNNIGAGHLVESYLGEANRIAYNPDSLREDIDAAWTIVREKWLKCSLDKASAVMTFEQNGLRKIVVIFEAAPFPVDASKTVKGAPPYVNGYFQYDGTVRVNIMGYSYLYSSPAQGSLIPVRSLLVWEFENMMAWAYGYEPTTIEEEVKNSHENICAIVPNRSKKLY